MQKIVILKGWNLIHGQKMTATDYQNLIEDFWPLRLKKPEQWLEMS